MGRRPYWLVTYGAELLYLRIFSTARLLRVTIVTISRCQGAEVSLRMVSVKTHTATSASQSAWYVLFFSAAPLYAFHTFPGKAQLFSRFFPFILLEVPLIDMSDNVSGASEGTVCILYRPSVSFYLLITLFWLFYIEFACIKSMCLTLFILFMIDLH